MKKYVLYGTAMFPRKGSDEPEREAISPLIFEVPDDEAAKARVALIGRGLNAFQPSLLVRIEAEVRL